MVKARTKRIKEFILLNRIYRAINADDIVGRQRFMLFRWFTLLSLFTCASMFIDIYATMPILLANTVPLLAGLFILNYILLSWHKNKKVSYFILVSLILSEIHLTSYFLGGLRNNGWFFSTATLLSAFMLLGTRAGFFFSVFVIANQFYFYFISEYTDWVSNVMDNEPASAINLDYLLTCSISLIVMAVQLISLEGTKNFVLHTLNLSRRELKKKNVQLTELSLVASKTDNSVIITDSYDKITWVNEGFTRMTGYTLDEVADKSPQFLVKEMQVETEKYLSDEGHKRSSISHELVISKKDGSEIWIQENITPIMDAAGVTHKFIYLQSDITTRKNTEEQIADYLNEVEINNLALERKNDDLDRFAYIVSHDLKAPLRAISSMTKFIEEDALEKLPEETHNYLNIIRGRIQRMEKLISDILAYSHVTRSKKQTSIFTMKELVQETIDLIMIPEHCKIEVQGGETSITSDRTRLGQLMLNLIVNAIKHHDKKEMKINVAVSDELKQFHYTISDNGPGIASEYHEKIFQIFQTLKTKDDPQSSGVGLAIVKKIIDDFGGRIWVQSEIGKGTTFHFSLPKEKIKLPEEKAAEKKISS